MDSAAQLGPQTLVTGTVRGKGPIAIAGRVDGAVAIEGDCLIAARAALNATVSADNVDVRGTVKGDIKARQQITVGASAQVDGTLDAPRIEIAPEARVKGRLAMPLQLPRGLRAPEPRNNNWSS